MVWTEICHELETSTMESSGGVRAQTTSSSHQPECSLVEVDQTELFLVRGTLVSSNCQHEQSVPVSKEIIILNITFTCVYVIKVANK